MCLFMLGFCLDYCHWQWQSSPPLLEPMRVQPMCHIQTWSVLKFDLLSEHILQSQGAEALNCVSLGHENRPSDACRARDIEISRQRRLAVQQQRMQGAGWEHLNANGAAQEICGENEREEGLCVVCIEQRADTVFLCGHMCVCEMCSIGLHSCPICRRRSRPIRVFQT